MSDGDVHGIAVHIAARIMSLQGRVRCSYRVSSRRWCSGRDFVHTIAGDHEFEGRTPDHGACSRWTTRKAGMLRPWGARPRRSTPEMATFISRTKSSVIEDQIFSSCLAHLPD